MTTHRLLVTLVLALAAGAAAKTLAAPHPHVPPKTPAATQAPAPAAAESRRVDVAAFRAEFLAKDHSYSAAARAEAETRLARLESTPDASDAYFELELARIVALADNGHTISFPGPRSRRHNRVGIRLVPFGEDFYVLRAEEANGDLLGARLVAVDGQPIAKIREIARSLVGGTPGHRDRTAPYFLESPEEMHALGAIEGTDAALYRFETSEGRTIERRLTAEGANPNRPRGNADRWLYPQREESEAASWRTLLAPEKAPWAWQDHGSPFRWRDAPDLHALVIDLRQNHDAPDKPIGDFLKEMMQKIRERSPRNLVLDMRMNGGGDLTQTREFMQSLPELVPGRIFALTSPWTFSAAISSVGYLEQAAPERVTIVGETVGDRLQFWAEGQPIELPKTKGVLLIATERHDYLTGCKPFDDCHSQVKSHPISVPDLDPDLAAPWTIDAYRAGKDPGMEAIAAALRKTP